MLLLVPLIVHLAVVASGQDMNDDWVDPYDMLNYDHGTQSMKKSIEDSSQAELTRCNSNVKELKSQIEEQKKKINVMSQQPTCNPVFKRFLTRLLKDIQRLGLPSDSTEVLYDAKVKMSRQALTEIQTLLEGKENWRTGALDNAVSQILVDLKPHNYEAWRWRFEDTFGVELDTLLKISVIDMTETIKQYVDRLALRAFCPQRTATNEEGVETVKSALMHRERDGLREHRANSNTESSDIVGSKHAVKATRRIEMGWLHFDNGSYRQVKAKNGGGTRHLSVQKSATMGELLETGKGLFFTNGFSSKGPVEDFEFNIRDYSHNTVPLGITVSQLYEQTKLRMLRIYTTSKPKEVILLSDALSDFEPTDDRAMKTSEMQRRSLRFKTRRRHHWWTGTDYQVDHLESCTDLDQEPSGSMQESHEKRGESVSQSRPATPEMSNTEVLHPPSSNDVGSGSEDECLMPVSNQDTDQLLSD